MKTDNKKTNQLLKSVFIPYFIEGKQNIDPRHLSHTDDLVNVILASGARKNQVCKKPEIEKPEPSQPSAPWFHFWKRKNNTKDQEAPQRQSVQGQCYTIDDFPIFQLYLPDRGLPLGRGENIYWIRPTLVQLNLFRLNDRYQNFEVEFFFEMFFYDGNSGVVGYADSVDQNGKLSRYHIFPNGQLRSENLYPKRRLGHDIFRTIMHQILFAELKPEIYLDIKAMVKRSNLVALFEFPQQNYKAEVTEDGLATDDKVISLFDRKIEPSGDQVAQNKLPEQGNSHQEQQNKKLL